MIRTDAVYNLSGYWEAPRDFLASQKPKNIKIDISKCTIILNEFGYFDLYFMGKKIKRLTFEEFLKYRPYVKEFRDETRLRS